ncbi:MAG: hypothetical protein IAG10_30295 [Planctomycetaceae bacterium]|nr:hypothetical protein [Planctomycetaceae bacterium]
MDRRPFLKAAASVFVVSSLLLAFDTAIAEEPKSAALIQTLPADGVWVEFNANVKVNGQEIVPNWTVRSVGQAFHGGKQCRFLEMEQTSDQPQLPKTMWRVLVPEDEFGEGKDPLSKAVKRWVKMGTNEPEAVDSIELKDPIFAMLLAGPKENLKTEEAKEKVNWQQGDLECSVISGRNEIELGTAKFGMVHRVFRHKDVPFGLAGMHQELSLNFGGQKQTALIKMTLKDHGKEAKAKLPDLVP